MKTIENYNISEPLVLTTQQQAVLDALKNIDTDKYPLSQWYHGALYALDNHNNPDHVAQAAHSLRELLEKLPEVVHESDVQVGGSKSSKFLTMRSNIDNWLLRSKERNPEGWKGKQVDKYLTKALTEIEKYIELNKQPNRRERIQQAVATIDPMVNSLDANIQKSKRDQYCNLWDQLEGFAHHNDKSNKDKSNVAEFTSCLKELENIIFVFLAPGTAQNQKEIQTILNLPDKSDDDVESMFLLIEHRGANFVFFFKQVSEKADVTWLPFLEKKGYFAHPPNVQQTDEGSVIYPIWDPMRYLEKVSRQAPDEVIEIVRQLPETDNPRVYEGILDVALQLPGEQSVKLKPKMLEYVRMEHRFLHHKFTELLAHWTEENQISAALELSKHLVVFDPDPQSDEKKKRRKENPFDLGTTLYPLPQLNPWEYREMMFKGIRPLAEKNLFEVACFLIHATATMFCLRTHKAERGKN